MGFLGCNKEKCCNSACFKMIRQVAEIVHNWAVENYGEGYSLKGGCVEASELMVKILHLLGCENAKTVDGYVRLDNPDDGEEAFEPHVWVEIPVGVNSCMPTQPLASLIMIWTLSTRLHLLLCVKNILMA